MTEKNGAFRLSDMPRIKHPLRFTGIMTCELLMVYEAVCHPGSPMALMFTVMQIMLTGLAYFWSRVCVRMPIIRMCTRTFRVMHLPEASTRCRFW